MTNSENTQDNLEFNMDDVKNYPNIIKKFDEDQELELYSYITCSNDSDDFVKNCRGLVLCDGEKILSSVYTHEYVMGVHDNDIDKLLSCDMFKDMKMYNSYEGTMIRVFNHSNKWYVSTHRKLNAYKSKWSCEYSFGELFEQNIEYMYNNNDTFYKKLKDKDGDSIIERFFNLLNVNKVYMFLLFSNHENRIVCNYDEPYLFHTQTVAKYIPSPDSISSYYDDDLGIPKPEPLSIKNREDFFTHIENVDINKHQGIIMFNTLGEQYKVLKNRYKKLYDVRGNQASVKFRYIELRNDEEKRDMLYQLYPEFKDVFKEYENIFIEIAKYIYNSYVSRFIKKRIVTVPKEEYKIVREIHGWHIEDRKNNKININKVVEVMNKQSAIDLNKMRRRYSSEMKKREEYQQYNKFLHTPNVAPLNSEHNFIPSL